MGLIISGYQGIGKSTLCKDGNGFIDLESGNFWVGNRRDDAWPQVYAKMAVHLSMQGYTVFTSSHKAVRDCLKHHPYVENESLGKNVVIAVCYPYPSLRDDWCRKLEDRYNKTGLEKDYKSWRNAVEMFYENIEDMSSEVLPVIHIPIKSMDYNLKELVEEALKLM